jgi:hypothetical protein
LKPREYIHKNYFPHVLLGTESGFQY